MMWFTDGFPELYSGELIEKIVSGGSGGSGGASEWGSITGNIGSQTDLMDQLNLKANQSTMTTALQSKVDVSTYTTGINSKVDTTTYNSGLNSRVDFTTYNVDMGNKADKSYVDNQLTLKANATDLNNTNSLLSGKADVSTLATKMNVSGGTFTGDISSSGNINAVANLQENGVNLNAKYLLLSGGNSMTGALSTSSSTTNVFDTKGTVTILRMKNNNGTIAYVGASTVNSLQSGNTGFTAVKNMNIEGYNGLAIPVLNMNATDIQQNGVSLSSIYASKQNDIPYSTLSLQNGATVNNSRTPRYARINGVVYLQGEITNIAVNTVIGTLPVGCRPSIVMNFVCPIATSTAMQTVLVSIGTSGTINVLQQTSGATGGMCLNLSFLAEQ